MGEPSGMELTSDNSNYSRLSYLLIQEGTRRAQEVVLMHLPERKTLAQVLDEKRSQLYNLMTKQHVISRSQYELLYPFTGDMSKIDISLWLILARNITTKSSRKGINWNASPEKHDTNWAHDLIRLREIRNYLFHVSAPELVGETFYEIRTELVRVLRRLGTTDSVIDYHMERDLDPEKTKISVLQIREQYLEEQNALLFQANRQKRHTRTLIVVLTVLAVLVTLAVSIVLSWFINQKTPCLKYVRRIAFSDGVLYFMPRKGWNAAPAKESGLENLTTPLKIAAVFHTGALIDRCRVVEDCCEQVKYIQEAHLTKYSDIGYNYLIGNDGVVYEGRGSRYKGASCRGRNGEIVSIAIMGHYACFKPSAEAMVALYLFLGYLTREAPETRSHQPILTADYHLYGHCQINIGPPVRNVTFPDSPGAGVMNELQFWTKHWRSDNLTACDIDKECIKSSTCCRQSCNVTERDL